MCIGPRNDHIAEAEAALLLTADITSPGRDPHSWVCQNPLLPKRQILSMRHTKPSSPETPVQRHKPFISNCEEELETLTAASVKDTLRDLHVETIAFGDLGLEKQSG